MSSKQKSTSKTKKAATAPVQKNSSGQKSEVKTPYNKSWHLPFILILCFIAFIPALKAGFVAWDDGVYVYDNPLIKDLSYLKTLLTTSFAGGNYHPLTMLTYALNYQVSGEDAWSYHLLNLLLHLINCVLVYRFASLLSRGNNFIAFTTALLFAIHPMHVESVAWVSERKDVLYGMFFIAGLIAYIKYLDTNSRRQYVYTFLFLLLALLSKPAAVIFPLALFCIDFLRKRKWNSEVFTEKIVFFIPAILMGIITYLTQKEAGATGEHVYGLVTRILFAFYGVMMYCLKMFAPFDLAPIYPFPAANTTLPTAYYLSPIFFIALVALIVYSWRRYRDVAFGILFYLVNLLLVLQIVHVGLSVISERYTYIPYTGLFYAVGWIISQWAKEKKNTAYYIVVPVGCLLVIISYRQAAAWTDSESLWDQAIKAQPSSVAYTGKAMVMVDNKQYDEAIKYYSKALELDPTYHEAYLRRGNIYMELNKLELAYNDYRTALQLKPSYSVAVANMGGLLGRMGKYDSALVYLDKGLALNADYKEAYKNRGLTHENLQHYHEAIKDFEKFLEYEPANADVYNEIGRCYQLAGDFEKSIPPITKAISINQSPSYYLNRAIAYQNLGNVEAAKKDALVAKQGGVQLSPEYLKMFGLE